MGMYTELDIACKLKQETPQAVIEALQAMLSEEPKHYPDAVSDHALFKTESWKWMLHGGSAYFVKDANSSLHRYDVGASWKLQVTANIKNYDQEWQHFINFIEPWIKTVGYIGTCWYEEEEIPTALIVNPETGKVEWVS